MLEPTLTRGRFFVSIQWADCPHLHSRDRNADERSLFAIIDQQLRLESLEKYI